MYLKKSKRSSGRIYLSIADGYRDKKRGHSRTITVTGQEILHGIGSF